MRAEAVSAREAQLSVLRLVIPLLGATIALALNLEDRTAGGFVFSVVVPTIVILSFELWISEIYRSARAGGAVAAIEQRLEQLFQGLGLGGPIGWERWLRRGRVDGSGKPKMSQQIQGTLRRGLIIFATLYLIAFGSITYGLHLILLDSRTAGIVLAVVSVLSMSFFVIQALLSVRSLSGIANPPALEELWPGAG